MGERKIEGAEVGVINTVKPGEESVPSKQLGGGNVEEVINHLFNDTIPALYKEGVLISGDRKEFKEKVVLIREKYASIVLGATTKFSKEERHRILRDVITQLKMDKEDSFIWNLSRIVQESWKMTDIDKSNYNNLLGDIADELTAGMVSVYSDYQDKNHKGLKRPKYNKELSALLKGDYQL